MTSERYPTSTPEEREAAIEAAALTVQRGDLVVLPTDTVYGIAADAFDVDAVAGLLQAKGRGRDMPPPVLVGSASTLEALAIDIPDWVRTLVREFWPGPLTVVCQQQSSLQWDLGDTRGTVAIRMPDHELTREILDRTGPLAVSSANTTGHPAAVTADDAETMLGEKVAVIIDDGPSPGGEASTIIDATSGEARVLRAGALDLEKIAIVLARVNEELMDTEGEFVPVPEGAVTSDDAEDPPAVVAVRAAAAKKTAAAKSAAAKKAASAKKAATASVAAKKAPAQRAPAKKSPVKKTVTKKTSTAKNTTATKTAATKTTPAKKTPAKRAPAKKATPPAAPPADVSLFEGDSTTPGATE